MYAIGIVLARCGSKGIPYKNIVNINEQPLISYCLKAFSRSNIDEYFVSTDCEEVAKISKKYGAKIIERPIELSQDNTSSKESLLHAVSCLNKLPEYILLVQATSPLIIPEDINDTINLLSSYDSVVSVVDDHSFLWEEKEKTGYQYNQNFADRQPRQLYSKTFKETGSIYATKYSNLLETKEILSGRIGLLKIPKYRSFEIDNYDDLFIIESIIKNMQNEIF